MNIEALFGLRKGFENDYAELMVAWDEYSIESNPDGWDDQCAAAMASWGDDLAQHRIITITVDDGSISALFGPAQVTGIVTTSMDSKTEGS